MFFVDLLLCSATSPHMNCNCFRVQGHKPSCVLCVGSWLCVLCADGLLQRQRERGQLHRGPSTRSSRPGHLLHALLLLASGDCSILLLAGGKDTHTHTHTHTHSIYNMYSLQWCCLTPTHMNHAASVFRHLRWSRCNCSRARGHVSLNLSTCTRTHTHTHPAPWMTHQPQDWGLLHVLKKKKKSLTADLLSTDARTLFTEVPINNSRPIYNGCLMFCKQAEKRLWGEYINHSQGSICKFQPRRCLKYSDERSPLCTPGDFKGIGDEPYHRCGDALKADELSDTWNWPVWAAVYTV